MKKIFLMVAFFTILFMAILPLHVNAAAISPAVTLDKTVVSPGQTVTITINMGQPLGAYTFDIDFDTALFDYVSSTGVTKDSVTAGVYTGLYVDSTGGSNPSSVMTVTFTAKAVTASNPTQFSITASGLGSPDAKILYDDITTPIVKDVLVEPAYDPYVIAVSQPANIEANKETPIDVTISSAMGRNYDHLRLVAQVTTPAGATMKLLGTNSSGVESDVILSGWGDPVTGFALGGGAVNQLYNFRGLFSANGTYTLKLDLIDRDHSDAVVATKTVTFTVGPIAAKPTKLPKTGSSFYLYAGVILVVLIIAYATVNRRDR
ncbi:MAG: cohesin domain-containing protein [Firmicutes bacterium]|nr:cohesin domain-containing protein [Bacillota bacterium]